MRRMRHGLSRHLQVTAVTCLLLTGMVLSNGTEGKTAEERDETPDKIAARIRSGDPDVVPVLRRWLAQESDRKTMGEATVMFALAFQGLGAYRDTASVELVSYFYREAPLRSEVRQLAAGALASIGGKKSLPDLKTIVWDQKQSLETRCRAAAALVELGESLGREFLLLQYDLFRLENKTMHGGSMGPARTTLEHVYDRELVLALERRLADETSDTMRNNITTLARRMAINAEPLENLKAMAANTSWGDGKYRRYAAIEALASKAGPDCIPFLESLRPWDGIDPSPDHIQQRYLKEFAGKAIVTIRQRHWNRHPTADTGFTSGVEEFPGGGGPRRDP